MPGTGPLPGPSYGGVDFVNYDCGANGIWSTIWDHSWVNDFTIVKPGDNDTIVTPTPGQALGVRWPAAPFVMGIPPPFTGPVGMDTILPPGATFQWVFLFSIPVPIDLYSMASMGRDSFPRIASPVFPLQASGHDLANVQHMVEPDRNCTELLTGQFTYNFSTQFVCVAILNWLNDNIVMDDIPIHIEWFVKVTEAPIFGPPPPYVPPPTVPPVISPTQPPTGIINPSVVPPSVQNRITFAKANPGFTCDITRHERPRDLVQVFLGQKIRLTVESYGMYLGMQGRSEVVTQTRFQAKAAGGSSPHKTFQSQFRLEAIPGTLLPGAGTSSPAQDAAGTGAEVGMYHQLDVDGTGLDQAGLA